MIRGWGWGWVWGIVWRKRYEVWVVSFKGHSFVRTDHMDTALKESPSFTHASRHCIHCTASHCTQCACLSMCVCVCVLSTAWHVTVYSAVLHYYAQRVPVSLLLGNHCLKWIYCVLSYSFSFSFLFILVFSSASSFYEGLTKSFYLHC